MYLTKTRSWRKKTTKPVICSAGWGLTEGKIDNCWKRLLLPACVVAHHQILKYKWKYKYKSKYKYRRKSKYKYRLVLLPPWCCPARLIGHHHHHHWDPTRLTRLRARWRLISWTHKKTMSAVCGDDTSLICDCKWAFDARAGGGAPQTMHHSPALLSWSRVTCTFSWPLLVSALDRRTTFGCFFLPGMSCPDKYKLKT